MTSSTALLSLAHLLGLGLAVGSATTKLTLLLRCRSDPGRVPVFLAVARPITRLIILGLALLTLSGIGWLVLGYSLTAVLWLKLALVAAVWVLGPVIDNVAEPRFRRLAPSPGESPSPAFLRAQKQYLALEALATGLFYVIIAVWVLV